MSYNLLGDTMNLYEKYKDEILHYTYFYEDFYIKTYAIIKKDTYYKIYLNRFNYLWHGDMILEKLQGKGYIPIDDVLEKYGLSWIPDYNDPKIIEKKKFIKKRK